MNIKTLLVAAAAALLLPAPVFAQIYVSVQGGVSLLNTSDNTADGVRFESTFNPGYAAALKVGGILAPHWRLEGEAGYASNNVDQVKYPTYSSNSQGSKSAIKGLVNVIYDFTPDRRYRPYVGAGVGAAFLTINNIRVNGVSFAGDTDTEFAYQAIAGIEYAVTHSAFLYINYHYFATAAPSFNDVYADKPYNSTYRSQNVVIGLRYALR